MPVAPFEPDPRSASATPDPRARSEAARMVSRADERSGRGKPSMIPIPWNTAPTPCRGCGETIYFVTDPRTRRPHPVSVACPRCTPPSREVTERDPATGTEHVVAERRDGRGISHFANCPAADRFRR